jgi:hypothetical protein
VPVSGFRLPYERLCERPRESVGKAVVEVEGCTVAPIPEAAERIAGELALLDVDPDQFDAGTVDEPIELAQGVPCQNRVRADFGQFTVVQSA